MSALVDPSPQAELHAAKYLLGPWLIGAFADWFLQGILSCQFSHYWSSYRDDKIGIKIAVIGLAVITYLKSAQSFALVWIQNILFMQDIQGAVSLNFTAWWETGHPLMVAAIGLYVQTYLLYRLHVISKRWWAVALNATVFGLSFVAVIVTTYFITKRDGVQIAKWLAVHLGFTFAGDLILCLFTAFYLLRKREYVHPSTVGLQYALVRLTFQTAAPAALCAALSLIFTEAYGPEFLICAAFNMTLPKLYAVSMMWTLNARREMRAAYNGGLYTSTQSYTGNDLYGMQSERHNFVLSPIKTIEVRTQVEASPSGAQMMDTYGWPGDIADGHKHRTESIGSGPSAHLHPSP